jgi:hypothetical protein
MRSENVLCALGLAPFLSLCNPIRNYEPLLLNEEEGNTTTTNALSQHTTGRSTSESESMPPILFQHWEAQRGGAKGTVNHISPDGRPTFEFQIQGKWYPLIQLDCTNSYTTGTYKGDYYDICRNYLWLRQVLTLTLTIHNLLNKD